MIYLQHIPVPITSVQHRSWKESHCKYRLQAQGRALCFPRQQARLPTPQSRAEHTNRPAQDEVSPRPQHIPPAPRLLKLPDCSHGQPEPDHLPAFGLAGYISNQESATLLLPLMRTCPIFWTRKKTPGEKGPDRTCFFPIIPRVDVLWHEVQKVQNTRSSSGKRLH